MEVLSTDAQLWDCPNSEYHADIEHISNSSLQVFVRNPWTYYQTYLAKCLPRKEPSREMILGTLLHSLVLDGEVNFACWTGERRSNAGKEAYAIFCLHSFGKQAVDQEESDALYGMAEAIEANEIASQLLNEPGHREISAKWTHKHGIKLKCRWDHLCNNGVQLDVKTCQDATPEAFGKSVNDRRYDVQAALYTQGAAAVLGENPPFRFIAVSSKPPHECYVYELPDEALLIGHETINRALARLAKCRETDNWKDPRSTRINEVPLPGYYYSQKGFR